MDGGNVFSRWRAKAETIESMKVDCNQNEVD